MSHGHFYDNEVRQGDFDGNAVGHRGFYCDFLCQVIFYVIEVGQGIFLGNLVLSGIC